MKKPIWKVYEEGDGEIVENDIFDYRFFWRDIQKDKKKAKDDKEKFAILVRRELFYYFCGKCEHEIVVTSWPPYLSEKEAQRIADETKRNPRYRYYFSPKVGKKIDVYDQVMMNFDVFFEYLWNHPSMKSKSRKTNSKEKAEEEGTDGE